MSLLSFLSLPQPLAAGYWLTALLQALSVFKIAILVFVVITGASPLRSRVWMGEGRRLSARRG